MAEKIEWVSVGALGEAFHGDNNLEFVADLGGRTLLFTFEDGRSFEYVFADAHALSWEIKPGHGISLYSEESYGATKPGNGVYFVDFIASKKRATTVSLVIDLNKDVLTAVIGEMPTKEESQEPFLDKIKLGKTLTTVKTTFVRGTVGKPFSITKEHHERTTDLIGRRVMYAYSPTEKYEHIYLNPEFYSWRCLSGIEKGLCDTDYCHYYKVDANLYLFVWHEKIVPTLGVIIIDFDKLKTTGKICGYTGNDFQTVTNFGVGAFATLVNAVSTA